MSTDESTEDIEGRKRDHLRLALGADVGFATRTTGLDDVHVAAAALPERDLDAVDVGLSLWGRRLAAPLLVSCMTGGVGEAGPVNRALAMAAQEHRVAFGLGSGRALLEDPDRHTRGFEVRSVAPDVLLLANLGAVQLAQHGPADCRRLVDECAADALVLHLNAVQEAVQPGGDTAFAGVLGRIEHLCALLDVPVVVKEVGFGMAADDVARLVGAGVAGIDVAGAGGTNWARVEGLRDDRAGRVAAAFADWGWSTVASIGQARAAIDASGRRVVLVGSGGVRHGVDALKVLCLGADVAGIARGLLAAGSAGPEAAIDAVGVLVRQLRIAAWAAGAGTLSDLGPGLLQP